MIAAIISVIVLAMSVWGMSSAPPALHAQGLDIYTSGGKVVIQATGGQTEMEVRDENGNTIDITAATVNAGLNIGDDDPLALGEGDDVELVFKPGVGSDGAYVIRDAVNDEDRLVVELGAAMQLANRPLDLNGQDLQDGATTIWDQSAGELVADVAASLIQVNGADIEIDYINTPPVQGTVPSGNATIIEPKNVADGNTLYITQAALLSDDGSAVASNVVLGIATLDNAGGGTWRATAITGDGATVFDDETGSPLASWTNNTGGPQTTAVMIDNGQFSGAAGGSGADQAVYGTCIGRVA